MKNYIQITVLSGFILLGTILHAQIYSYEARMTNFEQVSEAEFQFDIQLRNNAQDPSTNKWAYNSSQFQIDINTAIFNGGQLQNSLLTVDNSNSDLTSDQQLSDGDFFYSGPNTALATNSPSMNYSSEVTMFDDNNWKTIAQFSVQLMNAAGDNYNNFGDVNPQFAFRIADVIVMRCDYTVQTFPPPTKYIRSGSSYQITDKTLTMDVPPDLELAGYYYTGSGFYYTNTRWNNFLLNGHPNRNKVPISTNNAIIDGACLLGSTQTIHQLQIKTGAGILIGTSDRLTTTGQLINDGDFGILSGPNTANTQAISGSFIDNGTITGNGSFGVQRYIIEDQWHYVSSPISDGQSGIFEDIWLKEFNEPDSAWHYIIPLNVPLTPMKGFAAWSYDTGHTPPGIGTTTVNFIGTLNTGNISIGLTNSGVDPVEKGFNFVGNPYPSAIDWDATGWTKTNIDNTIYIYNPIAGQYGVYNGSSGTNDVTNIIPNGSGFFVRVSTSSSSGTIGVSNSVRLHDSKPMFKDAGYSGIWPYIKLKTASEMNTYSDETVVIFREEATDDFDSEFDAFKLQGVTEAPQLSTVSEGIEYSINTLSQLEDEAIIPVHFSVGIDGIYSIEFTESANLDGKYIYLKDFQEDATIDLNEQPVYNFFSTVNDNVARFELLIMNSPLGTDEIISANTVKIYSDKNMVYIAGETAFSGNVGIYDMAGKLIYSDELNNVTQQEIKLNVNKGFYIVKLLNNDVICTEKVFITN